MPDNPITVPLPQDLPTDWTYGQTIGPNGTDVGLSEQHGYNYLMKQVNAAQQAAKETGEAIGQLSAAAIGAETPAGAQEKADAAKAEAIAASDPKGSAAAVSSGITDGTIKAASAAAADTAAKLAAKRTIALSGGATGTATGFDGSGNISIPVTALDVSKATAGTLPVARGGSGLAAAPSLLVNLASTTAAGIFTASPRPGVTGTLPVARGGTGQTTLAAARNAMGLGNTTGALPVANGGTGATSLGSITVGNSSKWGSYSIWKGTQAQYNALSSKSGTTLYFIVG